MPDPLRLYVDQMLPLDVAQALRNEGHDVVRASEVGQARADDAEILERAIREDRIPSRTVFAFSFLSTIQKPAGHRFA